MISNLCWDLDVFTTAEFYAKKLVDFDVIFIDEADKFFVDQCLVAIDNADLLRGPWRLRPANKQQEATKIICFSASKEDNLTQVIHKFVSPTCAEIDIPAEMEIVTKQSSASLEFVYCQ